MSWFSFNWVHAIKVCYSWLYRKNAQSVINVYDNLGASCMKLGWTIAIFIHQHCKEASLSVILLWLWFCSFKHVFTTILFRTCQWMLVHSTPFCAHTSSRYELHGVSSFLTVTHSGMLLNKLLIQCRSYWLCPFGEACTQTRVMVLY